MPSFLAPPPPAYLSVPDHVASETAAEAAEFAESCGMVLDATQRLVLDGVLAETDRFTWAAYEAALVGPRQNFKTFVLQALVLAKLYLFDDRLIIWSAHEFSTTSEAQRDLELTVESYDHLRKRVKRISHENGQEAIELFDDRRIRFKARTKTGGRGLTGDTVILDEAMILSGKAMGALLPTLSARPNPQVVYAGSAGDATEAADVLRAVKNRGRAGGDPRLFYAEWCAERRSCLDGKCNHLPSAKGCVLDDAELLAQANPAYGTRLSVDTLKAERRALPPAEFMRERLGWWEDPEESVDGIPVEVWAECFDTDSTVDAPAAFGVFTALDLSWSAVAWVGVRGDGLLHLEVGDYLPGTEWVAGRCAELKSKYSVPIVVLPSGPRSSIGTELRDVGVDAVEAAAADLMLGCGALLDRVLRRTVRHIGQPELDLSVGKGRRRMVGDAWTWALRASAIDISPLVALTLALWAALQPAPPEESSVYEERGLLTMGG